MTKDIKTNNLGLLFINISEREGEHYERIDQNAFLRSVFAGMEDNIPSLKELFNAKHNISWKALMTGDVAVFSNGSRFIIGVVTGRVERQFCFIDPETSIVTIKDFDEVINGYHYIIGKKVLSID